MKGLLLTLLLVAPAGDEDWKAGVAEVKITPEEPMLLAGYAARKSPFQGIESDLYAKALALEDSQGHRGVLVTTDLVGFNASVADPLCEGICERTGLKRPQILLNSSHTHSGPRLSLNPNPVESVSAEEARKSVAYTRDLQGKIVDLVARALARLEPARLSWGVGVATFVMNRREFTAGGVALGVNPRGLADRSVPVLRIDTPEGRLRAALFGCACHNTTLTGNNTRVCGDYAGFAQACVQERHAGVQAMFLLGCAGDANPWPRGTAELAREHGASLGKEVCRVLETKLQPVRGPLRVELERSDLPFQGTVSREELEKLATAGTGYRSGVARQSLAVLDRREKLPTHYSAPLALWQFGEDLTLVGLSGEVVVDYVRLLEEALGPERLWVAAYCNDKFGYLPSARVVREGGYEAQGLSLGYGGPGTFAEGAQDVVVGAVREMAEKAGRKPPQRR